MSLKLFIIEVRVIVPGIMNKIDNVHGIRVRKDENENEFSYEGYGEMVLIKLEIMGFHDFETPFISLIKEALVVT